ncbi:uncharacterized protein [Dermacentor andersoni]|uniref:uncharacterized protein isoform X2 n=1 Tax=Dermacentor andersoni TaxID=34620 RepID=UPI002417CA90|nr:extracellular matrix-binding protein ebh-like isoform X2 [Dermacentor andersoni]
MALNRLKAGRGLQPVPEESAANGTTADAHPDAAAVPVNPLEQCVKSADGTSTNNGNDIADRRLRRWFSEDASSERHPPDDVSEKEYRIWFPRAEVSEEDVAGRASSDWRTFREYRYTECSRAGRLEKTLSVDEVFNSKGSPRTAAVNPPTLAFHCVSCSNSDEDKGGPLDVAEEGRCRMLSSTKSELYREHRSQLLSRLEDDDPTPWEASSLKTDKKPKLSEASGDTGSEKEARTSVCQTSSKKVAFEDDNAKKGSSDIPSSSEEGLASAPAPRSLMGNESSNREAVSAGLQDASLVSEDDDFDDSKCTYVKVDSVDSEVEDETGVTRETVIGAPSLDDLGYIAEEPEDEVDETTGDLGNRNSSATTTHEAAQSERSSMVSSTAEASHQAPLSSKLGVKEELSETDERGKDLQFSKVTLDKTVPLAADVNALAGGKSLKCHSDESESSRLEEQYAKQISHHHNEPKNTVEAAPHQADLSDTETNGSDTKSEESVITVKGDAILLPRTNDQITDEVLVDTVSRSANKEENGLDTRETFITGERHNPELISGKTVDIQVPTDTVNSQKILGEANGSITSLVNVTEELQKTSKNVSVLVSESSSNSGASQFGTSIVDNNSGQLTNDAIEFQETKYSRKDLSESVDRAARESRQVFIEANAWHQEEIGMLRESQELTKNAAAHILDISDRMEEMLDTASANATNLLSSKCTFDSEMEANDEVGKRQHAGTIDEPDQNDTQESMNEGPRGASNNVSGLNTQESVNEGPKGASNKVSGLKGDDFLQFLKGGTLMDEVYELESFTCLSKADDVTQESVTVIMDDSLLSRVFPSDKKSAADEREDQQQYPDVCQDVKNSAENNLQIGELLKQDTYQSAEMCFLKNTEVKTQKVLMCFTGGEEHTKETLKTVSSILSDSLPRKDILQDDVAHVVGGVKKGDKHLAEGGLKGPREDMREHFGDMALKNSHDFRDEGASHHHPAGMPNENVNTIQDTGVITEKGSVTDHVPMILPDDHHLFKVPEISSFQRQEGTGVTRESNDVLEIDSTEQVATQHCLAERAVPQENSLSSSIKTSMLKDVIALNRTDDATSFDDASLQDDNDQGFESLPCDQTLDQEDLNEKQVKDELYNVEKHLPADNEDNRGADELTALLDELAEHGKETPVSLQYDTGVQTTPTDATGQNNEPLFEHKLRSSASIDGCDKEESAQKCAHGMRSDENAHPASAMSSENEVQVVSSVQTPESKSSESGSAVPDEHKVTEIAGRNEDSEDISDADVENTRKISEYYIDLHSVNTSGWQKTSHEKEEKASAQDEASGKFASEHFVNQATDDDNKIGKGNTETLEKEPIYIRVAIEASVKDGDARCEEFAMEKPANQSTSENEITEVKTGKLMSESLESAEHHEESAQYEKSETFLSNASVKKSTNENEIVKLKVESSETKLRNMAARDEEIMLHETSEEVADGATTHSSSGDIDVTKLKTESSVDKISEPVCNEASVPNETSEQTEREAPISQSTADEVTVVTAMAPVSEISETAMPNEADGQSETVEDFSSEELVSQGSGKKNFGKIGEERSEDQLVTTESKAQSKTSDELASERSASHITDDQHITNEKADAPGSEFLEFFDELSVQIKASDALASEESVNQSKSNILVTEVKAEASVSELPKVLMSTEASVHSKSEEFASGETVCQSTTDSDVTKVKADISISELLENVVSTEASERTGTLEESASEASVNENMNENITRVEPDTYVSESPEIALSTELSMERKTADELTSKESVNLGTNENEVGKVNAEASVSEMPELLVSIEGKMHSTSEEFASGGTAHPGTSDTEITKVKAETLFAEIPEIVVSDEASVGTETPEESASEALMNLTTDGGAKVGPGASVSDVPEMAVFVENSAENKTSEHLASDGSGNQNVNDHENTEVTTVTSASELPTLIAPNEMTDQSKISDELSSGEAVRHSASDIAFTQVKEGTSASKVSQITTADEASIQSKTSAKFENEVPVSETTNGNAMEAKADTSFEWPKVILSAETTNESKISDELSSGEAVHHIANDVAFTQVKEGTSASKVSQITTADEASIQSKTSAKFENEVPVSETTNGNAMEAKADTSFEWPKVILSAETTNESKISDELSSGEAVRHSASDIAFTQVKEGTSASKVSQITTADEASIQSKTSAKFENEVPVSETTNGNAMEAKADTSFEWPKVILSAETTNESKISDELSSGEAVHHIANDVAFTQVKEGTSASKVSQITTADEASIQSKTSAKFENEVPVSETTNGNAMEAKADTSFEWPKVILSAETTNESKISDELSSGEAVRHSASDIAFTQVKEGTSASKVSQITTADEASIQSKTSAKFENEVPVSETTNGNAMEAKADTSFEWPKVILSAETTNESKISDELSSGEAVHHIANDVVFTQVKEGTSASKVSQMTTADEASIQSKTSAKFENDVPVSETTNGNAMEAKADTSFEWPKVILSAETTDESKISDELSSGEAVLHSASDVAFIQVKEGTSSSKVSQITTADEASIQSKISAKFESEMPVSETTNCNVTEAKADTSFEWPKITLSNEPSVRSKSAEGFTSEESVNKGSCNEENAKADEEELRSESPETTVPHEASVQVVSVETEFQSSSDYEAPNVTAETSTIVIPEIIVSDEASIQSGTPEKVEDEALVNDSPRDDAIPEAKSEASASKLPYNEASVQSITSEEFASGESACEAKGDVEISTEKADVPISEMPEIAVSNEVTLQRKTYEELKSDAAVHENTNDNEVTEVIAGASVIELPEVTVPNEASVGIEITGQLTSNGHVQQSNSDNENTEGKPEANDLPEVAESGKPSVQISEEFASEESVTRNSGGNDATEVTPGTSMSKPPEFDATRKHSDSEDLDKTSSDTSETRMECITKDNTTPCVVLDGVAAQGQQEAAFDCASLPSNMTKRFANADSYDEMTEDNETASTGAESADGELRGIARSDELIEGGSIEEVDKVMEDVTGNSQENATKECVESNYSDRAHALDEERHWSQEASAQDSPHEKFAEQQSVYQFADDEKNVSQDSISEDSALEGVPAEFREATDDHHTAELGNSSIGVSRILLEDTADVTSAASNNERSMHTSEPVKKSCEGTGGHSETLAEAADEGLGNVDLDSKEHLKLRTTGSESVESEVLHHEILTSQDVVEAREPSTAEMYNTNIAGISLNSSLEQENRDNRSSLLAYAEEIVSTVLTKCVTYLGENDEALRRAELVGRNRYELNADTENAVKEKTTSDDYKEELRIHLPHSDSTNRGTPGDAFEPIVSRQSAFEGAIPPADHQYSVTSRDANQAAVVLPVAAEDEINSNEALNYPVISEQHDQSVNMEAINETITNSTMAQLANYDEVFDNAKSDVPLNRAEDAGLLLITKERHDGDASDSASISEALTEDGASSEPEPHSSVSAVKSNQEIPDQVVEQVDHSEEKLEEEERSVVARLLDEAGKEPSEGSETRQNFVESDNMGENSEPAHSVAATGRIIRQVSQLNEELFSDSAACVHTRRFERSTSDVEARAGDDARESEEAENEATSNSFSESSATTVSMNTEDSAESVSEFSTKASEEASDAVSANEVNRDNSDTSDACHTDDKDVENNKFNGTHSLDMPDSVADTSNNTAEGREESTSRRENRASVHGSNGQSEIPHDTEDGNGIGHQGWDVREQTKKTTVPENHDMFSQEVRSEVAVNNGENNKASEPCTDANFNGSARPKDKDVSKHESSATVDNDMDSLGALSTVYESSLEYVRSYTDEHISASDVTATVSGEYYAVGTTTISNISPLKNISALGGVFVHEEHSNEGKAELNSDESTISAPSCPLQTEPSGGTGDANIQHVANTISDPEVASSFIPEETAGALGRHVDMTDLSAGKMSTNTGEDTGTNDFEASNDWITLQETDQAKVAVEDHGDPIQPRKELERDQRGSQIDSAENVTQYSKNASAIWDQRSSTANSVNEGYIKAGDTSSRENDTEDAVLSELPKTKIADAHEALHQVEQQALEEDEVATMDFSDEEERSLGDTGAHEHIVFVDVHDIPFSQESGDTGNAEIEQEGAREEIVSSKTSGSAVTTTDSNGKINANRTEEINVVQLDAGVSAQNVEADADGPSSTSTHVHAGSPHAGSLSEKLQPTVEALKTAVVVHEETKLEALECSEDLLHSVATEADFSSDIYEQASDGLDADAGTDEDKVEQPTTALPAEPVDVSSAYGDQRVPTEEYKGLDQEGAQNEIKERIEDEAVPHKISSSDAVEDTIVPEHIKSPSNKSSTESEAGSENVDVVANSDLKCAVEDFSRLISSDGNDVHATNRKSGEKGRIHDEAVITEASNENVVPEVTEDEGDQKSQPRKAAGAKEGDKADNDNQEDSLKTDSSESFDLSAAGEENVGESGSRNVKENTTHRVTEAVEQSERTEGGDGASTGDPVRSTRIFQRTVKRTESTRTVRRTRSFLPYTKWMKGEARQRARQEARDEDVTEPVEETLVAQQAFPAMSIPRRGLCPMSDCPDGNVCSVAVQAFPSVFDQGVQVDFDEHDCITRLVELQIAMNEQEEVRRQDMKAACELVEKLEAMQLSESLMRTQLRAMDAERREQSAREARLRDELTAWQETVQQQQLLLQQLKEDLDDTEDTLAAQRQEANRLREQMLVLQESCDSGLLMVDVLGRADKEVQTPDGGGQQPFSSSSPYKGIRLDSSSPVYLDQLSQHRRLSALVSSQLEATANRIAQLRREAAANRPRGSAIDEYVQDLARQDLGSHQERKFQVQGRTDDPHLADRGRKAVPGGRPLPPREPPRGDRAPGSATAASAGGQNRRWDTTRALVSRSQKRNRGS